MTRSGWQWAVGAALCLVPACHWRRGEVVAEPVVAATPAERSAQSPYHPHPPGEPPADLQPPAESLQTVGLRETERSGPDLLTVRPRMPADPVTPDATTPPPEDPPLVQALRCYLDRRPAEAVAILERYDRGNQELLLGVLPVAVRLTEVGLGQMDPAESAALAAQLEGLLVPLRKRAPLVIERMCFCKFIKNFGDYEPWPADYAFRPGDKVEVYVQFRHLATELQGAGHAVRLHSKLRILSPDGREAAPGLNLDEKDHGRPSRSPRQDLYYACWFLVPKVPPGPYTFLLEVTDLATGRVTRKPLELRVGAGGATARGNDD